MDMELRRCHARAPQVCGNSRILVSQGPSKGLIASFARDCKVNTIGSAANIVQMTRLSGIHCVYNRQYFNSVMSSWSAAGREVPPFTNALAEHLAGTTLNTASSQSNQAPQPSTQEHRRGPRPKTTPAPSPLVERNRQAQRCFLLQQVIDQASNLMDAL